MPHDDAPSGDLLSDYDYALPDELVAQTPPAVRGASRLLRLSHDARDDGASWRIDDCRFTDFPQFLKPGDVIVLNDTRVIRTRLRGRKASGGRVEVFIESVTGEREGLAMLRASHFPAQGSRISIIANDGSDTGVHAEVGARGQVDGAPDRFVPLRFSEALLPVLERHGDIPLPPYIRRAPDARDDDRYQTVFASTPGASAAPTAGLHFDAAMLDRLRGAGVHVTMLTLHVGAGTFLPVTSERLDDHRMHAERYDVPVATAEAIAAARARGSSVVAVGTTVLRALEASGGRAGAGRTSLFIRPGHRFQVVDRLLTNFHLPRSTLLVLVSAFAGREAIRRAYAHAIDQRYRFFSYGDAMLIDCDQARGPAPFPHDRPDSPPDDNTPANP